MIQDFKCKWSEEMEYSELAEGVRYYKETEEGREIMCEAFEKLANQRVKRIKEEKDREIQEKEEQIQEKEEQIQEKEEQIQEKEEQIQKKEEQIQAQQRMIEELQKKLASQ